MRAGFWLGLQPYFSSSSFICFHPPRRYYLPYTSITRVFKRVAMSAGGFTGKGMFASMAYLVVEYDGGKQKQCNFKDERDVDALLENLENVRKVMGL